MIEKKSGVYKITSPSGKIYVGSTLNFRDRYNRYRGLRCKSQTRLFNSIKKYGFESHEFKIIEYCEKDMLLEQERFHALRLDVLSLEKGLNCHIPCFGDKKTELSNFSKVKMSIRQKGERNSFFGKKHSDSTLRLMKSRAIGKYNHRVRMVFNKETGIFYDKIDDAAFAIGVDRTTFRFNMEINKKNKYPSFIIIDKLKTK